MISANLRAIAERVVRRARRKGFVVASEVRDELTRAGLSDEWWQEVVAQTSPPLRRRAGRYYYPTVVSDHLRQAQSHQDGIRKAVRRLIRQFKAASASVERRGQDRLDFIQPVKVQTEDGREHTLLSRDLSSTGIRLVGTQRFLGQKVRVTIPSADEGPSYHFVVRVLWTCAIGDDLFENGGTFLEVEAG